MRDYPPKPRRRGLLAIAFAVVMTAMCVLLSPTKASAYTEIAHSQGASYGTIKGAMEDAINGAVLYMDADWEVSNLVVPEGCRVTIFMNGHTIKNTSAKDKSIFFLETGAKLHLLGGQYGETYSITYEGYVGVDEDQKEQITTTAGGLLTSSGDVHEPLIYGQGNNEVTLEGIAVAGAYTYDNDRFDNGGAISLRNNCTLTLKNGTTIEHNASGRSGFRGPGGGINVSQNAKIVMDNASIHDNYADNYGGGIFVGGTGFVLEMTNGSKIDNNHAGAGGGIYLDQSQFSITSSDGTGSISGNTAWNSSTAAAKSRQSGGGIHADSAIAENKGLIENIKIADNYSAYDGGGLELDQSGITLRNCTITGNSCKYEGGGIYDCDKNNTLDGCTVTGNTCNLDGSNYEGGGVYVWCDYDLTLQNKCIIKNNTRGKGGSADDVFLRENAGATAKAYIKGSLAQGSSVGVRTGITGDRRIAKNFKSEAKDCLFIDLNGYYVSYGNDDNGDAWQRHRELAFAAKLDGTIKARYKQGAHAVLVAAATKGDDKVFWHWDTKATTGLYPIGSYITEKSQFNDVLGFTMPQYDVNAVTVYATRAKQLLVAVKAPVAGEDLPQTARVVRVDAGVGGSGEFPASVTWYEVGQNGKKTLAAGVAKGGTTYVASINCAQSAQYGLYFSKSLAATDVTLKTGSGEAPKAASVTVDADTGALTVETEAFAKTAGDSSDSGTVKVEQKKKGYIYWDDIETSLPMLASLGDEMALADEGLQTEGDSLGGVEVSYAKDSGDVTVVAPAKAGYNFCNWANVPDGWDKDDVAGTVTIPESELDGDLNVTACYTPVVTEVEVEMDEPAPAAGEKLATAAKKIVLRSSDGEEIELVEAVNKEQCAVTWSPEAEAEDEDEDEDGVAGYSTSYTALIEVAEGEGLIDVEKVLATDASVKVTAANGASALGAEAAAFTVIDGKLYLAISFPATRDAKATSVAAPAVIELTFEQARACAESGEWPLASSVDVEVEGGLAAEGDIEWAAVEGFDASATGAQELTAKGKVARVATPDDTAVDTSEVSLDVSATIKVAAPENSGSGDKKDDESGKKADEDEEKTETTTVTETKTASKKGTPSTGDVTYGGLAGLLALAAACLAAARLSRRKN